SRFFLGSWGDVGGGGIALTKTPNTEVTAVRVVAEADPGAAPTKTPKGARLPFQVDVPPYADPLSSAPNPRAWWDEHRPLVLQTGALGPVESRQVSFSGFRVLTVTENVIEKIHFISTRKLEANGYRLDFAKAIEAEPAEV